MESLPWFGNPAYFTNLPDSIRMYMNRAEERSGCDIGQSFVLTPIKFWIYVNANGANSGVDDFRLSDAIRRLNAIFIQNGMGFRFYMLCPEYIINPSKLIWANHSNGGNTNNSNTYSELRDSRAINVHIVNDIRLLDRPVGITGGLHDSSGDLIVLDRFWGLSEQRNTFAHEIGHYFGLPHTHQNWDQGVCNSEAVNREQIVPRRSPNGLCRNRGEISCEVNGDGFCDTPADPDLGLVGRMVDCTYIGTVPDAFGVQYTPDITNIMSYSNDACRNSFSRMQRTVMIRNNNRYRYGNQLNGIPDRYEPDNSDLKDVPREIRMNETQCHTFHSRSSCVDAVDWLIAFQNQSINNHRIEISDTYGHPLVVQTVIVWAVNAAGTRGTQILPTSTGQYSNGRFWEFSCADLNNGRYLIEVLRANDGPYTITLKGSPNNVQLVGENLCIGNVFSVTGVPSNASVHWSSNGPTEDNIKFSSDSGTSVTITGLESNVTTYDVFVTISAPNGCVQGIRKTFTRYANNVPPFTIKEIVRPCYPDNLTGEYRIEPYRPEINYNWQCTSGCSNIEVAQDKKTATITLAANAPFVLYVTASDGCGNTGQASYTGTRPQCGNHFGDTDPCAPPDGFLVVKHAANAENTQFEALGKTYVQGFGWPVGLFGAGSEGRVLEYHPSMTQDAAQSSPSTSKVLLQNYDANRIVDAEPLGGGQKLTFTTKNASGVVQTAVRNFSFGPYDNGFLDLYFIQESSNGTALGGTFRCGAASGGTLSYNGDPIASSSSTGQAVGFVLWVDAMGNMGDVSVIKGFNGDTKLFFKVYNSGDLSIAGQSAGYDIEFNGQTYGVDWNNGYFSLYNAYGGNGPYVISVINPGWDTRLEAVRWNEAHTRAYWLLKGQSSIQFRSYGTIYNGGQRAIVACTNETSGDKEWHKIMDGAVADGELDMVTNPANNDLYVGMTVTGYLTVDGQTAAPKGQKDVAFVKMQANNGNLSDLKRYGSAADETVKQLMFDKDALFFGGELSGSAASRVIGRHKFEHPSPHSGFNRAYISMIMAQDFKNNPGDYAGPIILNASETRPTGNNANGSITITAQGGRPDYTYLWAGGATGAIRSGLAAGTYTVTAVDANGCSASLSITLTSVPPPPGVPQLSLGVEAGCAQGCSILTYNPNTGREFLPVVVPPRSNTPITWRYSVTNEGSVTINNIGINSSLQGPVCTITSLNPGQTKSCSKTTTLHFNIAPYNFYTNEITAGSEERTIDVIWAYLGSGANGGTVERSASALISNGHFTIFPNPTAESFTVQLANAEVAYHLRVFDALGRMVWTGKVLETITIDAAMWPTGLYRVHALPETGAQAKDAVSGSVVIVR